LPWVAAVLGLGLIAAACSASEAEPRAKSSPPAPSSPSVSTTRSPDAFDAAALETATPIKHVVFLIKENRTFDHLFGTFPGANGVSTGTAFGQPRTLTRGTDGRLPGDLPHGYTEALAAWNEGKMDGFLQGLDLAIQRRTGGSPLRHGGRGGGLDRHAVGGPVGPHDPDLRRRVRPDPEHLVPDL
jgi:phosphoesterase family protein